MQRVLIIHQNSHTAYSRNLLTVKSEDVHLRKGRLAQQENVTYTEAKTCGGEAISGEVKIKINLKHLRYFYLLETDDEEEKFSDQLVFSAGKLAY